MMKILISLLFAQTVFAQSIVFEKLEARGNGCPEGTVSNAITPDGKSLAVFFDELRSQVPSGNANPLVEHKTCSLSFTSIIPSGSQVVALEVSVNGRGSTILDQGVRAYFSTALVGFSGLARSVGPEVKVIETKMWRGIKNVEEDWVSTPVAVINVRSQCATNANNRIRFDLKNHLHAEILTNDLKKNGLIVLDTSDLSGLLKFTVKTGPCVNVR